MNRSLCWVAEPYLLIKWELTSRVRKPLLYLTMAFLAFHLWWSEVIDTKAAHEMMWAWGDTADMGERKETQPRGGHSHGLALAVLWALSQCGSWRRPSRLGFFASSLGLEKFSGTKRNACLCWNDICHNMSYSGTNLNKSVQPVLPPP